MSAIAEAAEQAPVAAEVVQPPASEALAPEITPASLKGLDAKTRDAILFGEPPAPEAKIEPPKEETPPATEPKAEEPVEPEKLLPNRISTNQFDDREKEAIALRHDLSKTGEKISLREALERVEAKYDGPKAAEAPKPAKEPETEPVRQPTRADTLRQEIIDLEAAIDQHDGSLVTPEYNALNRQYAVKCAQLEAENLRNETSERERQRDESSQRGSAREQSKAEVLKAYPMADDDDTLHGAEIARLFHEIQANPQHPDRHRFSQDDGPKWLVEKAAEKLVPRLMRDFNLTEEAAVAKIKGQSPEAKAPAKPAIAAHAKTGVPRTAVVTSPGSAAAAETRPPTVAEIKAMAKKDPTLLDKALGFNGSVRL